MRKPLNIDAELKALSDRAKQLKDRRVRQLGELVIATSADTKDAETLAGALLVVAETIDPARKESWRGRGAAFFQGKVRKSAGRTDRNSKSALAPDGGAASA